MKKNAFSASVVNEMNNVHVQIAGAIDETAVFPELRSEGQIRVDLSKVTRMNSVGMRGWCVWMQRFRAPAELVLIGCPVCMVSVFSSIKGILGKHCRVYSFVIPYYSQKTGESKSFLAIWGQHFDRHGKLKLPAVLDSQGHPMDMDVTSETYFEFLKP